MEEMKLIILGIVCVLIGGYLVWRKRKQLKETENRSMLWAARLDVFMSAIIMLGLGIYIIIIELIKLLK